jgi:hypothetical protein
MGKGRWTTYRSPHPPREGIAIRYPEGAGEHIHRIGHPPRYPLHSWSRIRRPELLSRHQPPPGKP